jgi:hypothetical protein
MGTTRCGSPSLWAMIEDSTDEFYMASSGEGSSGLPTSQRHSTGAPPAPNATTPWTEDTPATQKMTMVSLWMIALWPDIGLYLEQ